MCLERTNKRPPPVALRSGIGYKVYYTSDDQWYSFIHGTFQLKQWYQANPTYWQIDYYPAGFHIFLNREDARRYIGNSMGYVLMQVSYKEGHTLGWQYDSRIIIANKMRLNRCVKIS